MLLQAVVVTDRAYDYLVKDQPVKEPVFRYIERGLISREKIMRMSAFWPSFASTGS